MKKKKRGQSLEAKPTEILETPPPSSRLLWITSVVILATVAGAYLLFGPKPATQAPNSGTTTDRGADDKTAETPSKQLDQEQLVGRWLRPDGGYILEIRSATAEGKLEAAYFNPRSIHVARAEWQRKDGNLQVFIELQDVNYPGSTYLLTHSATENRMVGEYFQATQRETFTVEFVREK